MILIVATTNVGPRILFITQSLKELWHYRLGYISYKIVEKIPEHTTGISFYKIDSTRQLAKEIACESCLAGCIKESFNKKTNNCTT